MTDNEQYELYWLALEELYILEKEDE